jgi:hypothetical protein
MEKSSSRLFFLLLETWLTWAAITQMLWYYFNKPSWRAFTYSTPTWTPLLVDSDVKANFHNEINKKFGESGWRGFFLIDLTPGQTHWRMKRAIHKLMANEKQAWMNGK